MYAGVVPKGVTVEWVDPTGEVWNLTTGDKRVMLDLGQQGLHRAEVEQAYDDTGMLRAGVRVGRLAPTLAVLVGEGLTGQRWYDLHQHWWGVANSHTQDGVLRVLHPDGGGVQIRARLASTPGTSFELDPGLPYRDRPVEAWALDTTQSYWQSIEDVLLTIGKNGGLNAAASLAARGGGVYDLNFSVGQVQNLVLPAQHAPLWPTYTLKAPFVPGLKFGPVGAELTVEKTLSTGTLTIVTDPAYRSAVIDFPDGSTQGGWAYFSGPMRPLGSDLKLTVEAKNTDFSVSITPLYATPF